MSKAPAAPKPPPEIKGASKSVMWLLGGLGLFAMLAIGSARRPCWCSC
jgi:hypothetical protein